MKSHNGLLIRPKLYYRSFGLFFDGTIDKTLISYLNFLNNLQKLEEEVVRAAIGTMRKGTKKERRLWFDKVKAATRKIRLMEAAEGQ